MILSKSFVSLMSTTNFFFLRLDQFIQFLNTSSVIICLEFVFSNLCLTVSENLLSLSFQENPNLLTFWAVSLSYLNTRNLRVKWANNGSHRSIMTDWRRQTGRQAFFFRVIGSSSARVGERLADGDVIVVEVIGGPLLAGGFLGVVDISLRDVVLVGLITCGRLVLGQGAKVLSGVAQGFVHHILEDEVDGQKEEQGDQREDEGRSEWRCRSNQRNTQCAWSMDVMEWVRNQTWAMRVHAWMWITVKNGRCEVWCSHPCRLQQTTVSCKRSNCNKPKTSSKSTRLRFCEKTAHNGSPRSIMSALHMSSVVDFLVNCHELHQESLNRHQQEEELDDECHCWYFQNDTLSCLSPDSWWRRFNVVNASLKSERSLTGPIFPDLLREIHQFFLYRQYSSCVIR